MSSAGAHRWVPAFVTDEDPNVVSKEDEQREENHEVLEPNCALQAGMVGEVVCGTLGVRVRRRAKLHRRVWRSSIHCLGPS